MNLQRSSLWVRAVALCGLFALTLVIPQLRAGQMDHKDHKSHNGTMDTSRSDRVEDRSERAREAADVLADLVKTPDNAIPQELLERATAIAVIPNDLKAAFGVGGNFGKGLISERLPGGRWSTPAFIKMTGGSYGFQLGVKSTDYVLVFTNSSGVRPLLKGKIKLGADLSVAAGPVGRTAGADTSIRLNAAVYTYSRSQGLFAGVALNGAYIRLDDKANRDVFGRNIRTEDLLVRGSVPPSPAVAPFVEALDRYASGH